MSGNAGGGGNIEKLHVGFGLPVEDAIMSGCPEENHEYFNGLVVAFGRML